MVTKMVSRLTGIVGTTLISKNLGKWLPWRVWSCRANARKKACDAGEEGDKRTSDKLSSASDVALRSTSQMVQEDCWRVCWKGEVGASATTVSGLVDSSGETSQLTQIQQGMNIPMAKAVASLLDRDAAWSFRLSSKTRRAKTG